MTLDQIKAAVLAGHTVCWKNESYIVRNTGDQWLVVYIPNSSAVGLTHQDGVTMNEAPEGFFVPGRRKAARRAQAGASNPVPLVTALRDGIDAMRAEGLSDTGQILADPSLRLIAHQLAHLFNVAQIDADPSTYRDLVAQVGEEQ